MKKWQRSMPLLAGLLILTLVLGHSLWKLYQRVELSRLNRAATEAEVQQLEKRKTELEARVQSLRTPEGQEAEMRQSLPVAAPGEEVITLVDQPVPQPATTTHWWRKLFERD